MIDKTILAATIASSDNPAALAALALILMSLAEPINFRSQGEFDELIDKWKRALEGIDPVVVDDLIAQMRAARSSLVAHSGPIKQAS